MRRSIGSRIGYGAVRSRLNLMRWQQSQHSAATAAIYARFDCPSCGQKTLKPTEKETTADTLSMSNGGAIVHARCTSPGCGWNAE